MICEIFTSILSMGLTSNHTHIGGKGGTCHGFLAIDPKIFGSAKDIKKHLSTFLLELRNAPKAEGQERIYTHGEKEILAYEDIMKNGIDININTIYEMIDICNFLELDAKEYLGDIELTSNLNSSYN